MDQNNLVEEISLRELIEILIKQKKLIAIITVISILASGIFSFFIIKPTYESSMILMPLNVTDKATIDNLDGNIDKMLDSISKYPTMNIETYRQQVKTPTVMAKTIKDLGLEEDYTIESLASKITLETIKDTQLITIKKISNDPAKAAEIVNKVGENFIASVSENVKNRATSTSKYLATQMEIEKSKYDEALLEQKKLLSEPRGANELELELNALLRQVTDYKTSLNDLSIRNEALKASIEVAEREPGSGSSLTLNQDTGRVLLDSSETTLKMELAEVEAKLITTEEKIMKLQSQIESLQVEYQDKFHKESTINQKVSLSKKTYESFVNKYEEVKVTESAQMGEASITIISRAFPSSRPVGPRKALNVAIGTVLGLMVGVFAAFFIEYWQSTDTKNIAIEKTNRA